MIIFTYLSILSPTVDARSWMWVCVSTYMCLQPQCYGNIFIYRRNLKKKKKVQHGSSAFKTFIAHNNNPWRWVSHSWHRSKVYFVQDSEGPATEAYKRMSINNTTGSGSHAGLSHKIHETRSPTGCGIGDMVSRVSKDPCSAHAIHFTLFLTA